MKIHPIIFNFLITFIVIFGIVNAQNIYHFATNAAFPNNATADNIFMPALICTHGHDSQPITSAGVWVNLTFNHTTKQDNIGHTDADATNTTFTIIDTGIYELAWRTSWRDTAANPTDPTNKFATHALHNGAELSGSYDEKNSVKQDAVGTIDVNEQIFDAVAGDEIVIQITGAATTFETYYACTYADHCVTTALCLKRVA